MNKKQLIVAWVIGSIIIIIVVAGLVYSSFYYNIICYSPTTTWHSEKTFIEVLRSQVNLPVLKVYVFVIILGILIIYFLRYKKK